MEYTRKVNVATLIRKMHVSYPILHTSAVDTALYSLLIAELTQKMLLEGRAIVLPYGVMMHGVESDWSKDFCHELSGLLVYWLYKLSQLSWA